MDIGHVEKASSKRISVRIIEFKGITYVDVRNGFKNDKGDWIHTKKGICIPTEYVSDIINLLEKAENELKKRVPSV